MVENLRMLTHEMIDVVVRGYPSITLKLSLSEGCLSLGNPTTRSSFDWWAGELWRIGDGLDNIYVQIVRGWLEKSAHLEKQWMAATYSTPAPAADRDRVSQKLKNILDPCWSRIKIENQAEVMEVWLFSNIRAIKVNTKRYFDGINQSVKRDIAMWRWPKMIPKNYSWGEYEDAKQRLIDALPWELSPTPAKGVLT